MTPVHQQVEKKRWSLEEFSYHASTDEAKPV